MTENKTTGHFHVSSAVIDTGLCTGCGACVGRCPYLRSHRGSTVMLFDCDRQDGRCRRYCPRTKTDMDGLRRALFDASDMTPELGPLKGLFMTRATDPAIRARSQHGGTVTALVCLKLTIGLFCGWTLDWRKLRELVLTSVAGEKILGMEIPPSSHACMQVETRRGTVEIPIDQVNACVKSGQLPLPGKQRRRSLTKS